MMPAFMPGRMESDLRIDGRAARRARLALLGVSYAPPVSGALLIDAVSPHYIGFFRRSYMIFLGFDAPAPHAANTVFTLMRANDRDDKADCFAKRRASPH